MASLADKLKIFFGFEEEIKEEAPSGQLNQDFKETPRTPIVKNFKGTLINNQGSQKFGLAEIKVEEPRIYEDSLNIATYLRENKPVIVNLKHLDKIASKRLIDFVCGTAYAINGHMLKIGENIFLFTPENIHIANAEERRTLTTDLHDDDVEEESAIALQR